MNIATEPQQHGHEQRHHPHGPEPCRHPTSLSSFISSSLISGSCGDRFPCRQHKHKGNRRISQGRLQVGPGTCVPLGYGGMSTGVFISFAARELPRLAPALRFPVPRKTTVQRVPSCRHGSLRVVLLPQGALLRVNIAIELG